MMTNEVLSAPGDPRQVNTHNSPAARSATAIVSRVGSDRAPARAAAVAIVAASRLRRISSAFGKSRHNRSQRSARTTSS